MSCVLYEHAEQIEAHVALAMCAAPYHVQMQETLYHHANEKNEHFGPVTYCRGESTT
jgi:hypothetical protein